MHACDEKEPKVKVGWVYNLRKDQADTAEENSSYESIAVESENSLSDSESEMSSHTPKLEFRLDKGDWETFEDRLEIYFLAKGTATKKKWRLRLPNLTKKPSNY